MESLGGWLQCALITCTLSLSGILIWGILDYWGCVGPTPIPGIFSIPGYPVVGNFAQVINNQALVYMKWAAKYHKNVFQIRLGNKWVVVINSYDEVSNMCTRFSRATNSRPLSYIFHNVVSATQGFTIGSSPNGISYSRKKKAISSKLNQKSIQNYSSIIDEESKLFIRRIIYENPELRCLPSCKCPRCYLTPISDIDFMEITQLFILKIAVRLTYGQYLDVYLKDKHLAKSIIDVESKIIRLRSPISNLSDYFPILRIFPTIKEDLIRAKRDEYITFFKSIHQARMMDGDSNAINTIIGELMTRNLPLSPNEIKSICLTMISAGLDNTPLNFNHLMGHLSQSYGIKLQEKAYIELLTLYDGDIEQAWKMVAIEKKSIYVMALLYETLRFFTVLPMGLPRETTKDIFHENSLIPAGTTIFLNLYSANHDPTKFTNPEIFDPERWIDRDTNTITSQYKNFAFGEGSRKCAGNHLALMELYAITCRILLVFKIRKPMNPENLMNLDNFLNNENPRATSFEPYHFKVQLIKRKYTGCDEFYEKLCH